MNQVAPPAPRRSHHAPLAQVKTLGDAFDHPEFKARIAQAAPKHMQPDRMLSTFILAVRKTPKLAKVDLMSFLGACVGLAAVGLEPNTPLGHAYLIPFDVTKWNASTRQREYVRTDVNVIFGYAGLLDLTYRSGLVRSVHADVAWQTDEFDFHYGSGAKLYHKPKGGVRQEGELPVWAYMHAAIKGGDGSEAFEVAPMADILRIRDASQAYQSAVYARDEAAKKNWKPPASWTEAPWVKHPIPMIRKTIFRGGSKWLPKSVELAAALQWDEAQERRAMDYGSIIEGEADVLDGGLDALTDETSRDDFDIGLNAEPEQTEAELASARRPATAKPAAAPGRQGELVTDDGELLPALPAPSAGRGGAPAWSAYVKAVGAAINQVPGRSLEAWATANAETFAQAPTTQKLQIVKLFQDHCAATNRAVPEAVAQLVAPDDDQRWADGLLQDMLDIPDTRQLGLHMASEAVGARLELLKQTKPKLRQTLLDAAAARAEELERIASQEPDDAEAP